MAVTAARIEWRVLCRQRQSAHVDHRARPHVRSRRRVHRDHESLVSQMIDRLATGPLGLLTSPESDRHVRQPKP
jgi:hypothetical protein